MDAIWDYLASSPVLIITLVVLVAFIFSRLFEGTKEASSEDLVPHYKRFERREPEFGDRRKEDVPLRAEDEQRQGGRRDAD